MRSTHFPSKIWGVVRGGAGELGGIFTGTWHCPSWRLSIIAISQVGYLAIIDNLAGRPQIIICHVSIALVFQYRWLLLDTLLILRDDRGDIICGANHSGKCQSVVSRCGDVPVDFALLCHNGPYLGDDMHMCGLRRLHSTALMRVVIGRDWLD